MSILDPKPITKAAADATYATTTAVNGKLEKLGTKTDTSAGLFDWQNNAASGYLLHLRTGPNSSGAGVIGIGTDQGAGNGLLVSHKNTGTGILATGQPGSGRLAEFTSRGTNSGVWINVQTGGGAAQVNARDGAGFSDGVSTSGSTTFTSATAAFVAGDVGKSVVQLTSKGTTDPFGSIASGATIVSVTNGTTVELSVAATATGSGVLFNIVGRVPATTQALFRVMETDLLTEIVKFTRGGATFNTTDVASTPVRVNGKSGQTADIFQAYDGAAVKVFSLGANGGITSTVLANFTNGALLGATPMQVSTYSSHATIKANRLGGGTGDNFWAMGAGTTALSRFNKDGYFMTTKSAAPADADINTGELALWVDTTAGAAKLMIKAKDSAGTVKTGSVTLA